MGLITLTSKSRPDISYLMSENLPGIYCHHGEGCEAEMFRGPYNCHHSKDLMEEEMTQALVTTQPRPMALRQFTDAEVATIKNTIARGCSDEEVALFIAACSTMDLNPFAREIYAIRRRARERVAGTNNWENVERMVITIGVDGYRKVAASSGLYAGQEGPFFSDDGEHWTDVWLKNAPPKVCKVVVHGQGFKTPVTAICRWDRYAPNPLQGQWKDAGPEMLAKCTEVLALRRAFPAQMQQLDTSARNLGVTVDDIATDVREAPQEPTGSLSQPAEPEPDVPDGEYRDVDGTPPWEGENRFAEGTPEPEPPETKRRADDHDVLVTPDGGQGYVEKYAHEAMKSDVVKQAIEETVLPPLDVAKTMVRDGVRQLHKDLSKELYVELCKELVEAAPSLRKDGRISPAGLTLPQRGPVLEIVRKYQASLEEQALDPDNPTCCDTPNLAFPPDSLVLTCKACGTVYPT